MCWNACWKAAIAWGRTIRPCDLLDQNTTGDGMLTAIQVLNILKTSGKRMSALAGDVPIYPQILVNVLVENSRKAEAMQDEELQEKIRQIGEHLGNSGRILVRASGTEPLIRIMLEGQNEDELEELAAQTARILRKNITGRSKYKMDLTGSQHRRGGNACAAPAEKRPKAPACLPFWGREDK